MCPMAARCASFQPPGLVFCHLAWTRSACRRLYTAPLGGLERGKIAPCRAGADRPAVQLLCGRPVRSVFFAADGLPQLAEHGSGERPLTTLSSWLSNWQRLREKDGEVSGNIRAAAHHRPAGKPGATQVHDEIACRAVRASEASRPCLLFHRPVFPRCTGSFPRVTCSFPPRSASNGQEQPLGPFSA
jgi:hypothetical protein